MGKNRNKRNNGQVSTKQINNKPITPPKNIGGKNGRRYFRLNAQHTTMLGDNTINK